MDPVTKYHWQRLIYQIMILRDIPNVPFGDAFQTFHDHYGAQIGKHGFALAQRLMSYWIKCRSKIIGPAFNGDMSQEEQRQYLAAISSFVRNRTDSAGLALEDIKEYRHYWAANLNIIANNTGDSSFRNMGSNFCRLFDKYPVAFDFPRREILSGRIDAKLRYRLRLNTQELRLLGFKSIEPEPDDILNA